MDRPLVAVSYSGDDETRRGNLETLGDVARVVFAEDLQPDEQLGTLRAADVLIAMRLEREVPRDALVDAERLRFIQFLSAGVDSVDFAVIPPHIVIAGNSGGYAKPMAEHVMAMALALARRLPQRHAALARGEFDQQQRGLTLDGAVCGIVGFGGIGAATAALMRACGARIHAINTSGETNESVDFIGTIADLDELLPVADVLVISIPLTRATRGLIGARELAAMKPNAILVNVARGAIIDERALYEHLRANPDFSAGIDTWWDEPQPGEPFHTHYPFLELPNVIGSPHNSPLVAGTQAFAARHAAENVRRYLQKGSAAGLVRREDYVENAVAAGT